MTFLMSVSSPLHPDSQMKIRLVRTQSNLAACEELGTNHVKSSLELLLLCPY